MLMQAEESCLLLIDVQEKLVPAIHEHEKLIANCRWMLQVAGRLNVPILVSEQYPKGLSPTDKRLLEVIGLPIVKMEKLHFSCTEDGDCLARIKQMERQQIIVIGIEAHVCVLQTVLGLKQHGKDVFVVADATSSRELDDKQYAIARMRDCGIHIVSKEMVLFEWMHQSGTPLFKEMSKEFLR